MLMRIGVMLCGALLSLPAWAGLDGAALSANLAEHSPECSRFEQTRWLADLEAELSSSGYFRRSGEGLVWHTLIPIDSRLVLSADNP